MIVAAIDPGLNGGIALLAGDRETAPRLLCAVDVPTVGTDAKRRVDVPRVLEIIRRHPPDFAVIERAQAMPDQGSSSGFIYGRAVGALEACLGGLMIPWETVESRAWKHWSGLIGAGKPESLELARSIWPDNPDFARQKDHNRAEAALIARYWLLVKLGVVVGKAGKKVSPASGRQRRTRAKGRSLTNRGKPDNGSNRVGVDAGTSRAAQRPKPDERLPLFEKP